MDYAIGVAGLGFILLAVHLGASPLELGLIGTVGAFSYTVGCLVSGRLSDRYGRRRSVILACLATGCAWCGFLLVRRPLDILCILPFSGGGMSFFWPPLQAWLAELSAAGGKRELNRNIGRFNTFWCAGLMLGPVVAGSLWAYGHALPFVIAILTVLSIVAIAVVTPPGVMGVVAADAPEEPSQPVHPHAGLFLRLAWLGNFASSVAMGAVKSLFPKLGNVLGYSEELIGCLVASIHLGQLALFFVGGRTTRWHYRVAPLVAAQVLAATGMVVAALTSSPVGFAVGFAAAGVCAGVTYVGSLFYSLHGNTDDRGGKAGLHEAVLGAGVLLGPLLGGSLANATTLRAPYLLAIGTCVAAALLQCWMWVRRPRAGQG